MKAVVLLDGDQVNLEGGCSQLASRARIKASSSDYLIRAISQ